MATPFISRLNPLPRQDGVQTPVIVSGATWVDALVLAAGVAETYTLPTDAEGRQATILRLSSASSAVMYYKWDGVAAAPAADVADGTSSTATGRIDVYPLFVVAPNSAFTLSVVSAGVAVVTIEAWN